MAKFALGLVIVQADTLTKFEEFEAKYGKNYGAEERNQRMAIFEQNLEKISALNSESESAVFDHLGPFTDLSAEEFKSQHMGYNAQSKIDMPAMIAELDTSNLADSVDWTTKGAVNAIKDQKQCGSCWAFSTVANLEGAGFVSTGKLVSLSEQQLVDCDKNGDQGCQGGLPTNAFGWMKKGNGLVSEADYPYTAKGGLFRRCKSSGKKEVTKITDFSVISQDEDQIAAALEQYGPLSIGIDADPFQTYKSGILDVKCGSQLDHGVAIVGYGEENGKKYWKIRNSWGASWGEDGYIRVVRGKGECGLNTDVSTATGITVDDSASPTLMRKKYAKGFVRQPANGVRKVATITDEMRAAAPAALDWSTKGATTAVKDQGDCGSCWAYSATEGIEAAVYQATGQNIKLSEQQIISCDKEDGGCDGGDLPTAFDYVQKNGGIDTQSDYPDTSSKKGKDGKCNKQAKKVVKVTGYEYAVPPCTGGACKNQKESDMMAALNEFGPLSVCVNADWDNYNKGILKSKCSGKYNMLDHCVQLVGYDTTGSQSYWKVRNSWASDWGESGFIRLPMGENACGIADEAMYVKAEMASEQVTV